MRERERERERVRERPFDFYGGGVWGREDFLKKKKSGPDFAGKKYPVQGKYSSTLCIGGE